MHGLAYFTHRRRISFLQNLILNIVKYFLLFSSYFSQSHNIPPIFWSSKFYLKLSSALLMSSYYPNFIVAQKQEKSKHIFQKYVRFCIDKHLFLYYNAFQNECSRTYGRYKKGHHRKIHKRIWNNIEAY